MNFTFMPKCKVIAKGFRSGARSRLARGHSGKAQGRVISRLRQKDPFEGVWESD